MQANFEGVLGGCDGSRVCVFGPLAAHYANGVHGLSGACQDPQQLQHNQQPTKKGTLLFGGLLAVAAVQGLDMLQL